MNSSLADKMRARAELETDRSDQLRSASRILAARQWRKKYFPASMFGEPAWEMLLSLYLAESGGPRLTVTSLCHNSGFPQTTALRWLHFLEAEHLVRREPSTVDKRIYYIDLSETARRALDRFLLEAPLAD
jgi:DNA-binding MarR family transcriptional regulator